jgi:hypothetical protein
LTTLAFRRLDLLPLATFNTSPVLFAYSFDSGPTSGLLFCLTLAERRSVQSQNSICSLFSTLPTSSLPLFALLLLHRCNPIDFVNLDYLTYSTPLSDQTLPFNRPLTLRSLTNEQDGELQYLLPKSHQPTTLMDARFDFEQTGRFCGQFWWALNGKRPITFAAIPLFVAQHQPNQQHDSTCATLVLQHISPVATPLPHLRPYYLGCTCATKVKRCSLHATLNQSRSFLGRHRVSPNSHLPLTDCRPAHKRN